MSSTNEDGPHDKGSRKKRRRTPASTPTPTERVVEECEICLGVKYSCRRCGGIFRRIHWTHLRRKDERIRNLRALLARERLFRRQWQEEARRNYYRLQPRP